MRAYLLIAVAFFALACPKAMAAKTAAQKSEEIIESCDTLQQCFVELEATFCSDGYCPPKVPMFALLEAKFGEATSTALLRLFDGPDTQSHEFADAVLSQREDWTTSDIPALEKAVAVQNNANLIRKLIELLPPAEVIDRFFVGGSAGVRPETVADLIVENDPALVLRLLPALESEETVEPEWRNDAEAAIWLLGSPTVDAAAPLLIDIARDRRERVPRRIAALRAIAAMEGYAHDFAPDFRRLVNDRSPAVRDQARMTLVAIGDPSISEWAAKQCIPSDDPWSSLGSPEFLFCLSKVGGMGTNARQAGDVVLAFLNSRNAMERVEVLDTLRRIGYREAISAIVPMLRSNDWREVFFATAALGEFEARDAVAAIDAVARDHWMWELRAFAELTRDALLANNPTPTPSGYPWITRLGADPRSLLGFQDDRYDEDGKCVNLFSDYAPNSVIEVVDERDKNQRVEMSDGYLQISNEGELADSLVFVSSDGEKQILGPFFTEAVFRVEGGALAIHGIGPPFVSVSNISVGSVSFAHRTPEGVWTVKPVAQLPTGPGPIVRMTDDTIGIVSAGRLIEASRDGVENVFDQPLQLSLSMTCEELIDQLVEAN